MRDRVDLRARKQGDAASVVTPTNLLSQILVLKDFIPPEECEIIRRFFQSGEAEPIDKGVSISVEKAMTAVSLERDLMDEAISGADVDAADLVAAFAARAFDASILLAQVGDGSVRERLMGITSLSDVDAELGLSVIKALNALKDDPGFGIAWIDRDTSRSSERIRAELTHLRTQGILHGSEARPRDDADALRLRWLNVTVLEDLVLPGIFRKANRFFTPEVDPARLRAAVAAEHPFAEGRPSLASFLERYCPRAWTLCASGSPFDLERAFLTLVDGEYRPSFVETYGESALRAAAGSVDPVDLEIMLNGADATRDDRRLALAMLVKMALQPAGYRLPERPVQKSYRNSEVVDHAKVSEVINRHLTRLVESVVEPYFGVAAEEIHQIELVRYGAGGFHLVHADGESAEVKDGKLVWSQLEGRNISLLLYLSKPSEYTGGRLWFPEQGILVQPELGMAVVFPSDRRFTHAAQEITSGTRYHVIAWLRCAGGMPQAQLPAS